MHLMDRVRTPIINKKKKNTVLELMLVDYHLLKESGWRMGKLVRDGRGPFLQFTMIYRESLELV